MINSARSVIRGSPNCFLASAKRYSGILRTVESRGDNFKIYCLFAVYQTHFSLLRRSVCLFVLVPLFSFFVRYLLYGVSSSFSSTYQPLSFPVFPRFSLRDPVTMIKRIRRVSRILRKAHPSFSGKLGYSHSFISFSRTLDPATFLPLPFLSSRLTFKRIEFSTGT